MDNDLNTAPLEEDVSLLDELTSAFEAANEAPEPAGVTTAPTPAPVAAQETPEASAARAARDAQGRFAKTSEPAQKTIEPASQSTPAGTSEGAILPPVTWSAAAKADFAKLPEHVRNDILKREKDIESGLAQWQDKGERLNRLDAILAPRRERFQLAGIDEVRAVQALFAAQDYLERDPVNAIAYLARQAGVDLRRYAVGPQAQAAQPPMPPQIQALMQEVATLKGAFVQQHEQAQQAVQSQYGEEVKAFASDPKNLYLENVRGDMVTLLRSGGAKTLQDAYDKSTWAHPEIRPLLIAEQTRAQADAAEQARRAKTGAARHASGSVNGSPLPGSTPAGEGPAPSIRAELERAFQDAS